MKNGYRTKRTKTREIAITMSVQQKRPFCDVQWKSNAIMDDVQMLNFRAKYRKT